nr:unnamed protein product [Digitaria exilis]
MPRITGVAPACFSPPCGVIPVRSRRVSRPGVVTAYADKRLAAENARVQNERRMELETRIRNQLLRPELPPSSYDTAWVSMVPLRGFNITFTGMLSHAIDMGLEFPIRQNDGFAVPALHPLKLHCQLSMVDMLEKMGISQHFVSEIKSILDMTYSCWLQKDEEIMMDVATCAMAFRLLRMNGYDVSSDELHHVAEPSTFHDSLQGYLHDTKSVLELYRASKVSLSEYDVILDNIGSWSGNILKDKLHSNMVQRTAIFREMEHALKFPFYATMERLEHKRNIEHFDTRGSMTLKTEYFPYCASRDLHTLAVEDFVCSQSVYQDELRHLDRWHDHEDKFYSEQVKTVFSAIYTTTNQLGARASAVQGRDVTKHLAQIWLDLLRSMMVEVEWQSSQHAPTLEEYMRNAVVSFALGPIVLPALYFVRQELLEHAVKDQEYDELFRLMSTCGRLLNDIQGFEVFGSFARVFPCKLHAYLFDFFFFNFSNFVI